MRGRSFGVRGPLMAKRAFPLTPEDATAESVSRFGEEARRAAQESAKDKYSGFDQSFLRAPPELLDAGTPRLYPPGRGTR